MPARKGQDHLLAISGRADLPAAVTDVIVDRGEGQGDPEARQQCQRAVSPKTGYSAIVARADGDDELIEILGLRIDLPAKFLRDLLRRAKEAVRDRLLAIAPPSIREEIRQVLNAIAGEAPARRRSYGVAEELVKLMKGLNELDDAAVYSFAEAGKFDEVTVSLAVLNDMPLDMMGRLMEGPRNDLILIPCRSAKLELADGGKHPAQPADRLPDRRADAGSRPARFPETVDGDRPAHRAVLAAS